MSNTSIIYGIHAVTSAINNDGDNIVRLIYVSSRRDKRIEALLESAKTNGIIPERTDKYLLDALCGSSRHQSIACEYKAATSRGENELFNNLKNRSQPWLLLVLDGVQDPHNLGACLRTANAAGVDAVIAPKDRASGITPVVRKVAAGAANQALFYQVTNLKRTLNELQRQGLWVIGTTDKAEQDYTAIDYTGSVAIILGAEEKGMRRLTREACDELVTIPMLGSVSSLNVSVATGICLFEVLRQRRLRIKAPYTN